MGLLEKMAARRGVKQWSEPPFWELPEAMWPGWSQSWPANEEKIPCDYLSYVEHLFKCSPAVFACIRFRMAVLSEARLQWRPKRSIQSADFFGTQELALLEQPWPNASTSDLLARMELVSSLAGNYYATVADDQGRLGRAARGNRRIVNMRPDWTTIVIDSASGNPYDLDAQVVGYLYSPLNAGQGYTPSEPVTLLPEEVVHFVPFQDPAARFRGMSWLTSILPEVCADKAATRHKGRFFENGATPQMVVTLSEAVSPKAFEEYVVKFKAAHAGADNAYKTLFLAGGADARTLGANFQQMDFRPLQEMSETRIAMVAGVHPTVVGMSSGLQGSSLNQGNFDAAARLAADGTLRPWWKNAAESLRTLVTAPGGAELWYDDRDIAFLREDATSAAAIRGQNASTLSTLIDCGYEPDAAVEYLQTNDVSRLKGHHTGMVSVQLLPPGATTQQRPGATTNGSVNGPAQAALAG
jgi:phage portal protein BeeE